MTPQSDRDAQNRMYAVELAPATERRFRLTGLADGAILKAGMLVSRDHPGLVANVKASASDLRACVARYGGPAEDVALIVEAAEKLRASMAELVASAPIMGSAFYSGTILESAHHIIAELNTPLPTAKAKA